MSRGRTLPVVATASELASLRDCPQKWQFAYVERLRPRVAPRPLAFGTAVHAGLAAGYAALRDALVAGAQLRSLLVVDASQRTLEASVRDAERTALDAGADPDVVREESRETLDLASWMLAHYWRTFEADLERLVPLSIEEPFELPLRHANGRSVRLATYRGVVDLVAYDAEVGDLVLVDHKTTSGEVSGIDRRVEIDPQMSGYLWALREQLRARRWPGLDVARLVEPGLAERIVEGRVPTGRIAYNVLRKKRARSPETTQKGLVSSASIDTLASVYEAALVAQEERGLARTQAQVERLDVLRAKGDAFLSRREFWRSDDELRRWLRETVVDVERARSLRANPQLVSRNAGSCTQAWSMPCVYRAVCLQPDAPELRAPFRVAEEAHEEVAAALEASDDSVGF